MYQNLISLLHPLQVGCALKFACMVSQVAEKQKELEAAQREVQDLRDQADSLVSYFQAVAAQLRD
jgi:cell division protein FtsB